MPRVKKLDRFQQMVDKKFGVVLDANQIDAGVANALYRHSATALLRKYHRSVVRMVENAVRYDHCKDSPDDVCRVWAMEQGSWLKRDDLLGQLKKAT